MSTCPTCGGVTASTQDAIDGRATYGDTQGGHNDRHTLVMEAAERLTTPTPAAPSRRAEVNGEG